jgi:hypothetical protein
MAHGDVDSWDEMDKADTTDGGWAMISKGRSWQG